MQTLESCPEPVFVPWQVAPNTTTQSDSALLQADFGPLVDGITLSAANNVSLTFAFTAASDPGELQISGENGVRCACNVCEALGLGYVAVRFLSAVLTRAERESAMRTPAAACRRAGPVHPLRLWVLVWIRRI